MWRRLATIERRWATFERAIYVLATGFEWFIFVSALSAIRYRCNCTDVEGTAALLLAGQMIASWKLIYSISRS